jgi:hypothetical protein
MVLVNIKVREKWYGTRGGCYFYVREDNKLKYLGDYATERRTVDKNRRGQVIEYEVPEETLKDKLIYEFEFSNSGYFFPHVGQVEAFLKSQHPGVPDYNLMREVKLDELRGLEFEVKDPLLDCVIREFKTNYIDMIQEIKQYAKKLGAEIFPSEHAQRTADLLMDPEIGLMECLAIPCDEKRLGSLEAPMRLIHQFWVSIVVAEALGIKRIKETTSGNRYFWLGQGQPNPLFIGFSDGQAYTFWLEFQPHPTAHWAGAWTRERFAIRPDIVICKGQIENSEQVTSVDLMIECKNEEFGVWQSDIEEQIIPYLQRYQPKNFVLVSLKPIPEIFVKKLVESLGVRVFHSMTPKTRDIINQFKDFINQTLS